MPRRSHQSQGTKVRRLLLSLLFLLFSSGSSVRCHDLDRPAHQPRARQNSDEPLEIFRKEFEDRIYIDDEDLKKAVLEDVVSKNQIDGQKLTKNDQGADEKEPLTKDNKWDKNSMNAWGKRAWKNNVPSWGKRSWSKNNMDSWGKRAFDKNTLSSWGKRRAVNSDSEQLDSKLESGWKYNFDSLEGKDIKGADILVKKSWNKNNFDSWGKRSEENDEAVYPAKKTWNRNNFDSWGKRAWKKNDLSTWGKRGGENSLYEKRAYNKNNFSSWGKRTIENEDTDTQ